MLIRNFDAQDMQAGMQYSLMVWSADTDCATESTRITIILKTWRMCARGGRVCYACMVGGPGDDDGSAASSATTRAADSDVTDRAIVAPWSLYANNIDITVL